MFAGAYTRLPFGFYHSTVIHEQALASDAKQIASELQDAVRSNFQTFYSATSASVLKRIVDVNSIYIYDVICDGGKLTFNIFYIEAAANGGISTHTAVQVSLSLNGSASDLHPDGTQLFFVEGVSKQDLNCKWDVKDLCPQRRDYGQWGWAGDGRPSGFLVLTGALRNRIGAFAAATSGFPSEASGSFFRMLYFSAITITTVGFGDIVPITPLSRFLVAFEAVLGIVLAGFFLNAIANESAARIRNA